MTHAVKRPLKVGLFIGLFEGFTNGHTSRWPDIADMARRAEQVGFDSVWLPDHFLIRDTPEHEPIGTWECTAMLAALAAVTTSVELGALVLCTSFRNPVTVAKLADTIDEISGGRLILGLGAGYHDPEYRALGIPTDHRYSRFAEAFEIISKLLREGSIDFEGRYYRARECVLRPRAGRKSGPPIMVGAHGRPRMLNLTARYADLWNAFLLRGSSRVEDLVVRIEQLDAACKQVGRDPSTLKRTATVHWNATNREDVIPSWIRARYGPPLQGGPKEIAELLQAYARVGISHLQLIVWPQSLAGVEACRPILETLDGG